MLDSDAILADASAAAGGGTRAAPGVAAIAAELPARIVENEEIAAPLGIDSDWIASRTGVRRRRMATDETLVELAARAGSRALAMADTDPAEVDLVLVATMTPDQLQPHAAPQVAQRLGANPAGAVDVGAACTGFLSALSLASAQLEAGRARAAVVVGADLMSRVTDYSDRQTAGVFGDGAGAAVLTAGPGRIGEILLRSDGARGELIQADHSDRLVRMDGRATFRAAVSAMSEITLEVLSKARLSTADIDLFVYHQANSRIISAVGERLELPADRVVDCIADYGNTTAATIPIAIAEAASEGRLPAGSRVLISAFGAGLTWGAGIIEWEGAA